MTPGEHIPAVVLGYLQFLQPSTRNFCLFLWKFLNFWRFFSWNSLNFSTIFFAKILNFWRFFSWNYLNFLTIFFATILNFWRFFFVKFFFFSKIFDFLKNYFPKILNCWRFFSQIFWILTIFLFEKFSIVFRKNLDQFQIFHLLIIFIILIFVYLFFIIFLIPLKNDTRICSDYHQQLRCLTSSRIFAAVLTHSLLFELLETFVAPPNTNINLTRIFEKKV